MSQSFENTYLSYNDSVPLTCQDEEDAKTNAERYDRLCHRKALFKKNHLTQSKSRNRFTITPDGILQTTSNTELRQFTDQIIYLLTCKSMESGLAKRNDLTSIQLAQCTEDTLIAALFGLSNVINKVATTAGKSVLELKFPEDIINQRKQMFDRLEKRTFLPDAKSGSKSWFEHAETLKQHISFNNSASELLEFIVRHPDPSCSAIEFDYHNLAAIFRGRYIFDFHSDYLEKLVVLNAEKSSLLSQHRKVEKLKKHCESKIFGQSEAIASVSDMVAASISSKQNGCLGIATFMGAAGTGKTALAESLTEAINTVFGSGFHTFILNMEMFSDKQSAMKLFGSGSQYVDSSLGDLTTEITCYPRTVVVVDEIEKAHPSVIQSMLTLLEKGQIKDQTTNKVVDFTQCFFIFTTNLGQQAAFKSLSDTRTVDLKSLLAAKSGQEGLSPEFISRLSRGFVAFFKPLAPKDLLAVSEFVAGKAKEDRTICWPQNMAELILETLGGNLEPRSIMAQPAKLKSIIMRKVCNAIDDNDSDPKVNIAIAEDITDFSFAVLAEEPQLKRLLKDHFKQCIVISSAAKLKTLASDEKVSTLLLPCTASAELITEAEKTGLTLYGLNTNPVIDSINNKLGGVEKVYQLADLNVDALTLLVQQVAKRQRLLSNLAMWRSRNVAVNFDYHIDIQPNKIGVTLQHPTYEQCFRHEDFEPAFMQTPCVPDTSFEDLIGMETLKKKMGFILQTLRGTNNFVLDMPKGYLLAGAPGTGKSYFAKAVAGECKVPFIPVNAADMVSGNVVENINHLFDVAERYAPCILFFDEFDAIALDRLNNNTPGRLAVNTLLTRLDGFNNSQYPVFVLAATNFARSLDPAIMRHGRFDKVVNIPVPDIQARISFIQDCAKQYRYAIPAKIQQQFARKISGATFGFIANLFRDIQLTILTEQKSFSHEMLDEQLITATIGNKKAVSLINAKTRLIVAYHETGHYLLSKRWFPSAQCTSLSIQEREGAGGVTSFDYGEEDNCSTRANIKARLQILLAGRAAEKLLSKDGNDITTGASLDIKQATELARMAISDCGFSDMLGLADFRQLPMLQANVEQEVLSWLNKAYADSEAYLQQNWTLVKCIANELFEKEVLNQESLDELTCRLQRKDSVALH
jgi:cell division protease FtsH